MRTSFGKLIGASVLGVVLAMPAYAANIGSLIDWTFTRFEDDGGETFGVDAGTPGVLEVGDTLRGIVDIVSLANALNPGQSHDLGGASGNNALSGVFEVVVTSKVAAGVGPGGVPLFNFTFGAYAPFAAEIEGEQGMLAGSLAGLTLALFEDPADDFTVAGATGGGVACTTAGAGGDCESNVKDGTFIIGIGLVGNAGESWTANGAPDVPAVFENISTSTALGGFNAFMSSVFRHASIPAIAAGFPEPAWQLSGALNGGCGVPEILIAGNGGLCPGADASAAYDNIFDAQAVSAFIPEPATLALLGMGLLGLGATRRRLSA